MGGERKTPDKLSREQIVTLYKAGPEAAVSLVEYLQHTIGFLQGNIEILQQNLEQVHQRLRAVEEQLKKNSRNSHKPPSSDGLKKIPKVRKPSGKKSGGQKGHKGTTLQMVEDPDIIKVHKVERCGHCGESLKGKEVLGFDRRQVFDLPPIKVCLALVTVKCEILHTAAPPLDGFLYSSISYPIPRRGAALSYHLKGDLD